MLSSSSFEILPDEVILHICQYLRGADVFFSFYNLNNRLNTTITGYCHYVNLMSVSYKQFEYAVSHVLPCIGSLVRTFVLNSNWETIIDEKLRSILFLSSLSLLFPRLQSLTMKWFTSDKLLSFIRTLQHLPELSRLDIRFLKGDTIDSLLRIVLAANDGRLSIVSFDQDSIDLDISDDAKFISCPNIRELTVNLTLYKFIPYLFRLIPNVCRLYLSIVELSNEIKCTSIISNLPSLHHLTIFQLRSINLFWTFEEISDILKAMPFLQEFILDLRTEDKRLVSKEDLLTILPRSLIKFDYFIRYYFSPSDSEIELSKSFSSPYSSVVCMLDEPRDRYIIHTLPCNLHSLILTATVSKQMSCGWKNTEQIKDLYISDITSVMEIFLIVQHFHRLQHLTLDARNKSHILTLPTDSPSIHLQLPLLKQIEICGIFDLFPLLHGAPNLDYLIISFDCLQFLLDNESTCCLLQTQIVRLNILDWIDIQSELLQRIAQHCRALRYLVITLKNTTWIIDEFVLRILSFWKDQSHFSIDVKGLLSEEIRTNLRQWIIDHSHIKANDSFTVECKDNWFDLWF